MVPSTLDMAVTQKQLGAVEEGVEVGECRGGPRRRWDPAQLDALLGGTACATG